MTDEKHNMTFGEVVQALFGLIVMIVIGIAQMIFPILIFLAVFKFIFG